MTLGFAKTPRAALLAALALTLGCGDDSTPGTDGTSGDTTAGSTTEGTGDPTTMGPADSTTGTPGSSSDDGTSTDGGSSSTSSSTTDADSGSSSTGEPPNFADPRGYTLFAPFDSRFTYLMDADGNEINSWESDTFPANAAYLTEEGHLLRVGRIDESPHELVSGVGGAIQEYDWEGNLVWEYDHSGPDTIAHHDIEQLPNGNVLVIAYETFTVAEALQAGRDPSELPEDGLWADYIVEIDPTTDTIVWEWHVWDHLIQDFNPMGNDFGVILDNPQRIDINVTRGGETPRPDWTHINAVAYNADLDQIVLSPRTFSEIWIIDHSTTTAEAASSAGGNAGQGGDLLYRWGNPATYQAGGEPERDLYFQHNPRWIRAGKPGAGNMLIFDNGDPVLRPFSRVVEIEPPVQPDGTYAMTGALWGPMDPVWSYGGPKDFFAPFVSGADRLQDGRTLVCSGPDGRMFEVQMDGTVAWEYIIPSTVFRAERYEFDYPAWIGLTEEDLAPRGPVAIDTTP